MERYEMVKDIGSGNFGIAKLVKDKWTNELFAVKLIERGEKIDEHVQREIMNHSSLKHPNIIRFKEVLLTPTHLAIVMEYAAGGELFERISNAGKFREDEARFFFQQLISGVSYCHSLEICHRDLKLENTLLDGSAVPRVKICDFGYSKPFHAIFDAVFIRSSENNLFAILTPLCDINATSAVLHSQPKSAVGTPAYIAPEVLAKREYDGKIADVWSCGVTLYVMLFGAYPFEDPQDPKNFRKSFVRILAAQYSIPDNVPISVECRHLIYRIFVSNPEKRITIPEIKNHPWFKTNFPVEFMEGGSWQSNDINQPSQSMDQILSIIQEARQPLEQPNTNGLLNALSMDFDDLDVDIDVDLYDIESSGEFVCPIAPM